MKISKIIIMCFSFLVSISNGMINPKLCQQCEKNEIITKNYKSDYEDHSKTVQDKFNELNLNCIGKGIDYAYSNIEQYKDGYNQRKNGSIFDGRWLVKYYKENLDFLTIESKQKFATFGEDSAKDLAIKINASFNYEKESELAIEELKSSFINSFGINVNFKYHKNEKMRLVKGYYEYADCTYMLADLKNDVLDDYAVFDKNYLKQLNYLANKSNYNYSDFDAFFDLYGSHVLQGATFGGVQEINYSMITSLNTTEAALAFNYANSVERGINSGHESFDVSSNTSMKFSIDGGLEHTFESVTQNLTGFYYGGNSVGGVVTSFNDISKNSSIWASTLKQNLVVTKYNKLVAIWDILPNEFSSDKVLVEKFKRAYEDRQKFSKLEAISNYSNNIRDDSIHLSIKVNIDPNNNTCGSYWNREYSFETFHDYFQSISNYCDSNELENNGMTKIRIIPHVFVQDISESETGRINLTVKNGRYNKIIFSNYELTRDVIKDCNEENAFLEMDLHTFNYYECTTFFEISISKGRIFHGKTAIIKEISYEIIFLK